MCIDYPHFSMCVLEWKSGGEGMKNMGRFGKIRNDWDLINDHDPKDLEEDDDDENNN
jgi:hypothetical protein